MDANNVLQEAIQVQDELKKTKDAQKSAESAIDEARGHITAADNDLKQVGYRSNTSFFGTDASFFTIIIVTDWKRDHSG